MSERKVIIEGSGKHCHVTRETLDILYGKGFELEVKKMLSQRGQYASKQNVIVAGPNGQTEVSIIGPCRKADQVELSFTDARALGFDPPIRESGDLEGSPGCKLIGPKGEVAIASGVIVAKRHLHLTPEDAEKMGIRTSRTLWSRSAANAASFSTRSSRASGRLRDLCTSGLRRNKCRRVVRENDRRSPRLNRSQPNERPFI
jgi:putative phosphotransacetylase